MNDIEMIRRLNESFARAKESLPRDYIIPVDQNWWRENKEQAEKFGISLVTTLDKNHG